MSQPLRVAVLNLQSGVGITKGYREYFTSGWKYVLPHPTGPLKKASRLLKDENVDIALLTELEEHAIRSGFVPQSELIKEYSDMREHEFFPTRTLEPFFNEGNSIMARHDILESSVHPLPAKMTPRVMGRATILFDQTPVTVFVAHLAIRMTLRSQQLKNIIEVIRGTKGPVILGGDFNERSATAFEIFRATELKHLCALPNFPSWNPKHPLAVLFFSDHFTIHNHYIPDAPLFSDHLPLVAEVSLKS